MLKDWQNSSVWSTQSHFCYNLFDSFFQCLSAQSMYMNIILLCFNLFIPGERSDHDATKSTSFLSKTYTNTQYLFVRYASNINTIIHHSAYPVSHETNNCNSCAIQHSFSNCVFFFSISAGRGTSLRGMPHPGVQIEKSHCRQGHICHCHAHILRHDYICNHQLLLL